MTHIFQCRHFKGTFLNVEEQPKTVKATEKRSEILTMFLGRSSGYKELVDVGVYTPTRGSMNETLKYLRGIS